MVAIWVGDVLGAIRVSWDNGFISFSGSQHMHTHIMSFQGQTGSYHTKKIQALKIKNKGVGMCNIN